MMESGNYNRTKLACYFGFVTQAITANFVPLLFLTFYRIYNVSYTQLAFISFTFFLTQLVVDFLCARFVDRIGYRKCIIVAHIASGLGLIMLAFVPDICPNSYAGHDLCNRKRAD